MDLDRRWLELEEFWLREGLMFGCILCRFAVLCIVDRVIADIGRKCGGHRSLLEAWSVWRGLDAKLSEVKIRASFVADVHRLVKSSF